MEYLIACLALSKRELGCEEEKIWVEGYEYEETLLSFLIKLYPFSKSDMEVGPGG